VGFGVELVPLNPDRLRYTDDLPAAASLLAADLRTAIEASATVGIDVLTGRCILVAVPDISREVVLYQDSLWRSRCGTHQDCTRGVCGDHWY
jgi:hypothetical protein